MWVVYAARYVQWSQCPKDSYSTGTHTCENTPLCLMQASHSRHGGRQRACLRASASQASDNTDSAGYTPTAYAALAAVLAASSAARLAAPSRYMQLANSVYPDATVQALVRLTGATLIPIVAALWCLKVRKACIVAVQHGSAPLHACSDLPAVSLDHHWCLLGRRPGQHAVPCGMST